MCPASEPWAAFWPPASEPTKITSRNNRMEIFTVLQIYQHTMFNYGNYGNSPLPLYLFQKAMITFLRIKAARGPNFLVSSALILIIAATTGCGGGASGSRVEYAYVASPEAILRDRIATIYNKTGVLHNGERVQVLEHLLNRRFVRVRSARGEEGWLQERYLTSQQTFDQLQRLAEQFKSVPAQAIAVARAQLNLHAVPGRKTEHRSEERRVGKECRA